MATAEQTFFKAVERQQLGDLPGAEKLYRRVLKQHPDHPAVLNNLAVLLKALDRREAAERALERALRTSPDHADAWNNLGTLREEGGRDDEALAAYERVLALQPDHADALGNHADLLRRRGRFAEALAGLRRAVAANPAGARNWERLGDALQAEGSLAEAEEAYRRSFQLQPRDALRIKHGLMLPPVYRSEADLESHRQRFLASLDSLLGERLTVADPLAELAELPFYLAFQGRDERETQARLGRLFGGLLPAEAPAPRPNAGTRPRIGLLSSHWQGHSVGSCYRGTAAALAEAGLEVLRFDSGRAAAGDTLPLPRDLAAARRRIAEARLDALIYTDLGFDPFSYFLSFSRLAPLQLVLNGHPMTSGVPALDLFVTAEPLCGPGFDEGFTERLVTLPWVPGVFEEPAAPPPPADREALGLPAAARLYCCPMMLFKLHPAMDEAFAGILAADPEALVLLVEDRYSPKLGEALRARFAESLGSLAARVRFLPYQGGRAFPALLQACDVLLDSFPFGGGTTSLAALAVGRPPVTLEGPLTRSRSTAGFYRAMGFAGPVAHDVEDYVRQAVALAGDPALRQARAEEIAAKRPVLYGNRRGAEALAELLLREAGRAAA
ncbi:Predicted O-linked N-acetylglucosamine transferase, SPINDLY family [Tistlia consotensis]|uniref:protein O-GlcNAc transferase n=1 Tax=Tistlia consotensis USBA 355 TaxID=560819 RepID=A0A1Y6BIH6_9PROT|nr:tetratricopeptide repeat protein [Tistlia consotensis]SMF13457.1 Predicted O-linked N-acetylglucosamine transferase, SPINDLY family [Tistlia consotensis USBA 355]SNR50479.1 Predicted O-linked N-acetylglucosamine transferase, SPINDLY family [Tistlia consotensis]